MWINKYRGISLHENFERGSLNLWMLSLIIIKPVHFELDLKHVSIYICRYIYVIFPQEKVISSQKLVFIHLDSHKLTGFWQGSP